MPEPQKILVVDDKQMMRDSVGAMLQRVGFEIVVAADGERALQQLQKHRCAAVVSDLKMDTMGGMDLLRTMRQGGDTTPLVLMTAFGGVSTAVQAMREGAFDFIQKPFEGDQLVSVVQRAVDAGPGGSPVEAAPAEAGLVEPTPPAVSPDVSTARSPRPRSPRAARSAPIAASSAMRRLMAQIDRVAPSSAAVLVRGESGAGKEVVARAIHDRSNRRAEPMLCVNCAALAGSLLESELFGHERGAFTGADKLRKGRFELADGGTLLLDEISEISPLLQAKLLRVLQEGQFERVGSSETRSVDVRIIATTNRDLARSVADGTFRQDLFYRLNVLPLELEPLRSRRADVEPLARFFLRRAARREGREPLKLDGNARTLLELHPWPGNVRELQNICERAAILCDGDTVTADLVRPWLDPMPVQPAAAAPMVRDDAAGGEPHTLDPRDAAPAGSPPLQTPHPPRPERASAIDEAASPPVAQPPCEPVGSPADGWEPQVGAVRPLAELEREQILAALDHFDGNRTRTAEALGIGLRTLGLKLKKWKQEGLVPATV